MKRFYFLCGFVVLLSMIGNKAEAEDFEEGGIYYKITSSTDKTVEVTHRGSSSQLYADEYTGAVTISSSVTYSGTTYSVTSIGIEAFYHCTGLTSITIPNSVTSIGRDAFTQCTSLTKADFSSISDLCNISFGNAFANPLFYVNHLYIDGQEITDLVIPNSVTSIGNYAFQNCSGLTSVTIGNNVTNIGDNAFRYCSGLTSVTIPNSVTNIGSKAFYICTGLTSVTIPNSVTNIGSEAFYNCTGLTSVTIPNSVTSIKERTFFGCTKLTSVTIGNSVTSIDYAAFNDCLNLTKVTIDSNTIVSKNNSSGNSKLRTIFGSQVTEYIIGDNVTSIGKYAFKSCTGLTSVTIGNSVTSIRDYAFAYCSGLTSITCLAQEPPTCSSSTFDNVFKNSCKLKVPTGTKSAYQAADQWKEFLLMEVTTGIAILDNWQLTIDNSDNKIYTLDGKQVEHLQKGVNIVRTKDGKVKKVLKK